MRKVINFLKKLNKSINYVNKLNNELSINNDYYISRMLVENRILLKKMTNQKLNIVLIAFEPATWLMFQSIYDTFSKSDQVNITVLVIPYAHSTLPTGTYKDDGLREYLDTLGIPYIYGYNEKTNTWIDLFQLHPDYVFYQAPYNGMYPDVLKSDYVCQFAQICHIPYGTALIKGEIENTIYPIDFFRDSTYCFVETNINKNIIYDYLCKKNMQFLNEKFIITGSTKIEALKNHYTTAPSYVKPDSHNILWLPRWNTKEGICTFFDYYNVLINYVDQHNNATLTLRPHPLMFQNFITTGEMTEDDIQKLKQKFSTSKFMLDTNRDYYNSFNTADILITDPTSLIYEFFPTKKPIIYTYKNDIFNDLGVELSKGIYWVHNQNELEECLNILISGKDSLLNKRKEILAHYFFDTEKSSKIILDTLIN